MIPKQTHYLSGITWDVSYAGWSVPACGINRPPYAERLQEASWASRPNSDTGSVVPNWRSKIANAISATSARSINLLTVRSTLVTLDGVSGWRRPGDNFYNCNGVPHYYPPQLENLAYYTLVWPQLPSEYHTIASQLSTATWDDVRRRLTSMYRDGLLGETLANAHKAIDLIRHPFRRATGLLEAYKRRARQRVTRFMRQVPRSLRDAVARGRARTADAWGRSSPGRRQWRKLLEVERNLRDDWLYYSFGVCNALMDLEAIVKATNREMRKGAVRRVSARRQATTESIVGPGYFAYARYSDVNVTEKHTCALRHSVLLGVLESQRDQTRREDSVARLGLSAEAFIPTLWAVMPQSWAVDYFLDVDGHIDDWLARKLEIRWGSESASTRNTCTTTTVCTPKNYGFLEAREFYAKTERENDVELFYLTRTAVSTIPYKPWTFTFPDRLSQFANLWAVHSPSKLIGVKRWT